MMRKKLLTLALVLGAYCMPSAVSAQTYPLNDGISVAPNSYQSSPSAQPTAGLMTCTMKFKMSGLSLIYKHYDGTGEIQCRNGDRAQVILTSNSVGFTIGKSEIEGDGVFSEVKSINEIFGDYASMESHVGFINSFDAQLLTRGEISLALKAQGRGIDIGATFGDLNIKRR